MNNDSETVAFPAGSVKFEKQNASKTWTMWFGSKSGIYIWGRESGGEEWPLTRTSKRVPWWNSLFLQGGRSSMSKKTWQRQCLNQTHPTRWNFVWEFDRAHFCERINWCSNSKRRSIHLRHAIVSEFCRKIYVNSKTQRNCEAIKTSFEMLSIGAKPNLDGGEWRNLFRRSWSCVYAKGVWTQQNDNLVPGSLFYRLDLHCGLLSDRHDTNRPKASNKIPTSTYRFWGCPGLSYFFPPVLSL